MVPGDRGNGQLGNSLKVPPLLIALRQYRGDFEQNARMSLEVLLE